MPLRPWALKYLSHYFTAPMSALHEDLADTLNAMHADRGRREVRQAPRGSGKSVWISQADPVYAAVNGLEKFIIISSDSASQSEKYLDTIRWELEENDLLRRDYPHATGRGPVWRSDAIETKNGVRIEALSTGMKLRGRKHHQYRPTQIIVDDPQNSQHIISELQRSRSWEWITKDVMNAGDPTTNIIVAGTALHEDGIVCKLAKTPGWSSKLFKSITKWPTRMDLWAEWENILRDYDDVDREEKADAFLAAHPEMLDGEVLWPERTSLTDLMLHRASIGETAFNFEHQNEPNDPLACEWPPSLFTHAKFWFDVWPDDLTVKVLSLDPSKGGQDKLGDYSAYVKYARDRDGWEYVEADLKRRPPDQIVADGVEIMRTWLPDLFVCEGNAWQDLLRDMFVRAAKLAGVECPFKAVVNTTNKLVRIRRLTEPLAQHRMRFKSRSPGTTIGVDQLRQFPTAAYDDFPDALELARREAVLLFNQKRSS